MFELFVKVGGPTGSAVSPDGSYTHRGMFVIRFIWMCLMDRRHTLLAHGELCALLPLFLLSLSPSLPSHFPQVPRSNFQVR